jgi:predicted CXXCH cytochrome family protein
MALLRDSKARAKRIDLSYFRAPHPFRRALRLLSVGAPLAAAAWIASMAARGDERIYDSGPVATRHAMLEKDCASCHTGSWALRYTDPAGWQSRLDAACLKCHDGPVHHANANALVRGRSSAQCSLCHVEHQGRPRLAEVADRHCVSCHADLKTLGPEPHPASCPAGAAHRIHPRIERFDAGHPEFAVLNSKTPDPSVAQFNHAVHLRPDSADKRKLIQEQLKGLAGRPGVEAAPDGSRSLGCAYCHRPVPPGAEMAPVHYESHCRDCHPLKLKDERVPHVAPDAIRDFLRSRLARGGAAGEKLEEQTTEAEIPLYTSDPDGCMKCHKTDLGSDFPAKPPAVARTGIRTGPPGREGEPRRWFVHSFFDHGTHRELRCTECHAAEGSKLTSDVLLPSRGLCLNCHSASGGAGTACVSCHRFHERPPGGAAEGRLRIGEVIR